MYIAANITLWLLAFGVPVLAFLAFWVPTNAAANRRKQGQSKSQSSAV